MILWLALLAAIIFLMYVWFPRKRAIASGGAGCGACSKRNQVSAMD